MKKTVDERYRELKAMVCSERKKPFKKLMQRIENETEYLRAPASTKYHMCKPCGLLEHSVSVAETMLAMRKSIAPDITEEQCVIVALLHDLGKVGYPGAPQYTVNRNYNYNNNSSPYNFNKSILYMAHSDRSLYLIQKYGFELSPEEFQAILTHDGMYIDDNKSYAMNECKLAVLLHFADLWSCRFVEKN